MPFHNALFAVGAYHEHSQEKKEAKIVTKSIENVQFAYLNGIMYHAPLFGVTLEYCCPHRFSPTINVLHNLLQKHSSCSYLQKDLFYMYPCSDKKFGCH